jgi:homogentisate 1,2-dioxygenase
VAATELGQRRSFKEEARPQTRGRLSAANASSNPRRISTAVQNRTDTNYVTLYTVINRKGKALTQAAMIFKNFGVNAAMGSQCVNVRQDGFAKIASKIGRLAFIESKPGD